MLGNIFVAVIIPAANTCPNLIPLHASLLLVLCPDNKPIIHVTTSTYPSTTAQQQKTVRGHTKSSEVIFIN